MEERGIKLKLCPGVNTRFEVTLHGKQLGYISLNHYTQSWGFYVTGRDEPVYKSTDIRRLIAVLENMDA